MSLWDRYFPWGVVTFAAVVLILVMFSPPAERADGLKLHDFGQLPVQGGGRIKPLDSVARTTLLVLGGREGWRDAKGNERPAVEWLLDVMTSQVSKDGKAETHPVFRVTDHQVLELLGLKEKSGFRYSIEEMQPRFAEFEDKVARAMSKEPTARDMTDNNVLELRRKLERYMELAQWQEPRLVPPKRGEDWQTLPQAAALERSTGESNPALRHVAEMLMAHSQKDVKKFNAALAEYRDFLRRERPDEVARASLEAGYNDFSPLLWCVVLYVVVFVLTCVGWLVWGGPLRRAASWLTVLTFVVHTGALVVRMYLAGRPPVTNLYSSAVFIGWAGVVLGLILERVFGLGLGNCLAGVSGFLTVLIAKAIVNFMSPGDTLDVLQAVLDTNFWLATHVVCITLGYAATYVAGLLGMAYILIGVFTRNLTRDLSKTLAQAMYGVVCFAMFLSFTGTVLGGIWADQSWGRFWGWDPKENGALLIVLINAMVLHARWGGMVKERGMAVLNVVGNIVTTWSWFGTNQLGVGLHSYGFMNGAVISILVADGVFLAFIVAGMLPPRVWASFNVPGPASARGRRG